MAKPTAGTESTPTPVHRIVPRFGKETTHRLRSVDCSRWIIAASKQALGFLRSGLEHGFSGVGSGVANRSLETAHQSPERGQALDASTLDRVSSFSRRTLAITGAG